MPSDFQVISAFLIIKLTILNLKSFDKHENLRKLKFKCLIFQDNLQLCIFKTYLSNFKLTIGRVMWIFECLWACVCVCVECCINETQILFRHSYTETLSVYIIEEGFCSSKWVHGCPIQFKFTFPIFQAIFKADMHFTLKTWVIKSHRIGHYHFYN